PSSKAQDRFRHFAPHPNPLPAGGGREIILPRRRPKPLAPLAGRGWPTRSGGRVRGFHQKEDAMPHPSRVALITGCGKPIGIGNSTASALAAKGVAVVVSDVRPAGVANEHNAPGDLDTNWGGVDSLVEQIAKSGGI